MTREQRIEKLMEIWERIAKLDGSPVDTESRSKAYVACECIVDAFDILNDRG